MSAKRAGRARQSRGQAASQHGQAARREGGREGTATRGSQPGSRSTGRPRPARATGEAAGRPGGQDTGGKPANAPRPWRRPRPPSWPHAPPCSASRVSGEPAGCHRGLPAGFPREGVLLRRGGRASRPEGPARQQVGKMSSRASWANLVRHDTTRHDRTGQDRTGQDRTGQDRTRCDVM